MGLRLRHTSLFLTYVLAPLCAISNFNYEQVNPRNFPAAMLLHGRLSFRKPVLPSPSSGLVHRAFPIIPTFFMTIKHNSIGIADLGIVHNCQHFLNSTESTNY